MSLMITFWRVTDRNGYLGNWYPSIFKDENGTVYDSVEKYVMVQKARLFGDEHMEHKILRSDSRRLCRIYGKRISNFNEDVWNREKGVIVMRGLLMKFSQNEHLRELLLSTGDTILVQGSPVDRYWGVGLRFDDPRIQDISQWRGENLLGKYLMAIRYTLQPITT